MTLHAIVAALGGDLYSGGRRANVAAPGHSRADRSISLMLDGDHLVIHGFGSTDWRTVRDHLKTLGLIDARGRLAGDSVPASSQPSFLRRDSLPCPSARQRVATAQALWGQGLRLEEGDLCHRHFRLRGVDLPKGVTDLRRHPDVRIAVYRNAGPTCPALLAAIRAPDGELSGVEITYLDPDGKAARHLRLPRKTVGVVPPASAVRLSALDSHIMVGEGVVTTLSAMARFGLPGWALLSAGNLARWSPPSPVHRVLIAGDRGRVGEKAALDLRDRLMAAGLAASVRLPPPGCGDWNDAVGWKGEEEGRDGAPTWRG